jgi:SAM-dependent methyltransferase
MSAAATHDSLAGLLDAIGEEAEMSDQPAATEFDAYRDSYDDAVNEALSFSGLKVDFFTQVKAIYLIDLLGRHFGGAGGLSVLDVGCGVGNSHGLIASQVALLAGVDISSACVDRARARNPTVAYHHYDGPALPFADGAFDAAFTICVMHHVPPPQRQVFTTEMARVVRPGGLVAVFEHNPANPVTRRVVGNCAFDKNAVLLRARETEALLARAGLERVVSHFILTVPAKGRLLQAVDRLFSPLRLGAQYCSAGQKPSASTGAADR